MHFVFCFHFGFFAFLYTSLSSHSFLCLENHVCLLLKAEFYQGTPSQFAWFSHSKWRLRLHVLYPILSFFLLLINCCSVETPLKVCNLTNPKLPSVDSSNDQDGVCFACPSTVFSAPVSIDIVSIDICTLCILINLDRPRLPEVFAC